MTTDTPPRLHTDLIDTYIAYLRACRHSTRTIETYEHHLRRAHHQLPHGLPLAYDSELLTWLGQPGYAVRTQRLRTTALTGFYAWAVARGHLDYSPAADLPRPTLPRQLPRPATDQQVTTILTTAPDPVRLWSVLAAYAGARAVEIARLDRADITHQQIRLHGKGDHQRLVPTHPAVWAAVRQLPPGPVCDRGERHVSNRAWRVYHRLGVPIGIHKLRSWFATTSLRATGDLAAVQDLLGHASPDTTRIYADPSRAQMVAAVAALPTLAPATAAAAAADPPPSPAGSPPR